MSKQLKNTIKFEDFAQTDDYRKQMNVDTIEKIESKIIE